MSQVIDRFERQIADLERALAAYRAFATQLALRGLAESDRRIPTLTRRVQEASSPTQFKRLLDELPAPSGMAEAPPKSDARRLMTAFADGVSLLGETDDPLAQSIREGGVGRALSDDEVERIAQGLHNFFASKKREFEVVDGEREELKQIVASLIDYLHSLRNANSSFKTKIETFITGMERTDQFDDVNELKAAALREMRSAHKASEGMSASVDATGERLLVARRQIDQLAKALEHARRERWTDALTGVLNRGFFDKALAAKIKEAKGTGRELGLIMLDIDHFKQFNDTYGHRAGDQVLRTVARLAMNLVQKAGIFCRYGGEEFAAILPGTGLRKAVDLAEGVRHAIREHEFAHKNEVMTVSVSLGVAIDRNGEDDAATLVEKADSALYRAKHGGRDRVES